MKVNSMLLAILIHPEIGRSVRKLAFVRFIPISTHLLKKQRIEKYALL